MKKLKGNFLAVIALVLVLILSACASTGAEYQQPPVTGVSTDDTLGSQHAPETQALISMLNHNPELKSLLEKSIAKAAVVNPDRNTNPVQTLDEYYDFIDWASKALPWSILPGVEKNFPLLYDQIDQSLDYFYFLNDQSLEELEGLGMYNSSVQYLEPYRTWLINFTASWGEYLNTTASWCDDYYQTAKADERFLLQDDTYESPENWKTFNQFFARYLSSPDKRPIAAAGDDSVFTSPADSTPQGVWKISDDNQIVHKDGVVIKSGTFTSIAQLLHGSEYAEAFAGGTLTHTFLDVNDYHRYHFPVSGTIKEVVMIPADDAIGGTVYWDGELGRYRLDADTPGWQNIETRACVIVETEDYGLVAILPIAMSQVSSVNFEDYVVPGAEVKKGDMLGCFLFGGSDIVMLFQKGVDFTLTAEEGKHILMGEEYGRLSLSQE